MRVFPAVLLLLATSCANTPLARDVSTVFGEHYRTVQRTLTELAGRERARLQGLTGLRATFAGEVGRAGSLLSARDLVQRERNRLVPTWRLLLELWVREQKLPDAASVRALIR